MNIETLMKTIPHNNVGELDVAMITAPFFGCMVGSVLFGVGVLQAYQYYLNYGHDSRARKLTVAMVCISDSVHFCFSANMVYTSLVKGQTNSGAVWSLKVMAVAQAFLIVFVQSFYLRLIWILSGNILLSCQLSRVVKFISFMTFIYALGIAAVFLAHLMQVSSLCDFSVSFERVICITLVSTAVIDCGIAFIMTLVLFKSKSALTTRGRGAMQFLVFFFVGTGLLTAIASVISIILYTSHRSTLLYQGSHIPIPRLYTNSILAMFNAKSRLKKNMEASEELKISSFIFFGDPVNGPSERTGAGVCN